MAFIICKIVVDIRYTIFTRTEIKIDPTIIHDDISLSSYEKFGYKKVVDVQKHKKTVNSL